MSLPRSQLFSRRYPTCFARNKSLTGRTVRHSFSASLASPTHKFAHACKPLPAIPFPAGRTGPAGKPHSSTLVVTFHPVGSGFWWKNGQRIAGGNTGQEVGDCVNVSLAGWLHGTKSRRRRGLGVDSMLPAVPQLLWRWIIPGCCPLRPHCRESGRSLGPRKETNRTHAPADISAAVEHAGLSHPFPARLPTVWPTLAAGRHRRAGPLKHAAAPAGWSSPPAAADFGQTPPWPPPALCALRHLQSRPEMDQAGELHADHPVVTQPKAIDQPS